MSEGPSLRPEVLITWFVSFASPVWHAVETSCSLCIVLERGARCLAAGQQIPTNYGSLIYILNLNTQLWDSIGPTA